jgi:hypothetical protein
MPEDKETQVMENSLEYQLYTMSEELSKKFDCSALVQLGCWNHRPENSSSNEYRISLVPGFDEDCTQYHCHSWNSLLVQFKYLMSKEAS